MDNVVQNISMEDIVPSNFQTAPIEQEKINSLAELIKKFGIADPILVRPKNGKFEIVLGTDKYHAAKQAGLKSIPAIIKEVDDKIFLEYLKINNKNMPQTNEQDKSIDQQMIKDNLPSNKMKSINSIENSDIINLSELSKKEYERDDFKMNNEQFNNNMMSNNVEQPVINNQPSQGPTFGGRFFPSLEDEPTNMNMMGGIQSQPVVPNAPVQNNNLIDLTDLSIEKEPVIPTANDFVPPVINNPMPEMNQPMNNIEMPQPDFGMSGPTMMAEPKIPNFETMSPLQTIEPTPSFQPPENIINLENLQNNNIPMQPMSEPTMIPNFNNSFEVPTSMPQQFDIPQNIASSIPEMNQPINNIEIPQPDFGMSGPTMMPEPEIPNFGPMSQPEPMTIPSFDNNIEIPTPMSTPSNVIEPVKDITPVVNTLKNLASSLEAFGYKININEEELATSVKVTIEVEK